MPQQQPAGAVDLGPDKGQVTGMPAGAVDLGPASPDEAKPKLPPEPPGYLKRLGQSVGVPTSKEEAKPTTIGGIPLPPGSGLSQVIGYGKNIYEKGKEFVEHPGLETGMRAAQSLTPAGVLQETFAKDLAEGNIRGAAGTATGVAGQFALGPILEKVGGAIADKPVTVEKAARTLTDAVNPHPQSMEGFESTLTENMPRIVDWAKRNGVKITDRASLQKAMEGAQEESYQHYYKNYIEPVKDVRVSTTQLPGYKGATIDYNTATIDGLENRLSTINNTLNPKFQKGGMAAQVAVGAGEAAALNAEGSAIRNLLNETVGKKLGIDPAQIRAARGEFGGLRDIADKTTRAINEERYGKNLERRGMDVPTDRAGIGRYALRKLTAKNPDKTIARTMEKVDVAAPKPRPTVNPPVETPKPRGNPPQGTPTEIGTQTTTPEQVQSHQQQIQTRAQQVLDARQARAQQVQRGKAIFQARVQAIKAATEKLGPKASVKEIMAEADKSAQQ